MVSSYLTLSLPHCVCVSNFFVVVALGGACCLLCFALAQCGACCCVIACTRDRNEMHSERKNERRQGKKKARAGRPDHGPAQPNPTILSLFSSIPRHLNPSSPTFHPTPPNPHPLHIPPIPFVRISTPVCTHLG